MEEAEVIHFPGTPQRTNPSVRSYPYRVWRFVRRHWIAFYRFHRYMGVPPQTLWVINFATGAKTPEELQMIKALRGRFKQRKIDHVVIFDLRNLGFGQQAADAFENYVEVAINMGYDQPINIFVVWPEQYIKWDGFYYSMVDKGGFMEKIRMVFGGEPGKRMGPATIKMIPIRDLIEV